MLRVQQKPKDQDKVTLSGLPLRWCRCACIRVYTCAECRNMPGITGAALACWLTARWESPKEEGL